MSSACQKLDKLFFETGGEFTIVNEVAFEHFPDKFVFFLSDLR